MKVTDKRTATVSRFCAVRRCTGAFGRLTVAVVILSAGGVPARADQVLVAVATNFAEVLEVVKLQFEQETGHSVSIVVGSTGKLYAQIRNGAPFDVFLAADQARPERLEAEGEGISGTRYTYALGRLTLWSSDPQRLRDRGASVLGDTSVRHVAIASPELAPYGAAARQTLERLGVWDTVAPKLVIGQDIGEAYSMVATGNAEVGFVALSSVLSPRNRRPGSRWDVPQDCYRPIRQDAILLRHGIDRAAATGFLAFLRTPGARAMIVRYGYRVE